MSTALFISVFLIAACGLIYELIAGTLASYLLGDSVLQFSTVIGSYLFAMGIGSYLSRFLSGGLVARFISIELMVGLVGGFSSSILFLAFAYTESFRFVLYGLVLIIGTLVGLEIPLLMRILKGKLEFRELVANVLTFDYLGALGASLLFPLLLVPRLGLIRSALLFGLLNAGVALWSTYLFAAEIRRPVAQRLTAIAVIVGLVVSGQTFYLFTVEYLRQFGALKAIGVTNWRLMGMILLQALLVWFIGFSFGTGLAAAFFEAATNNIPTRHLVLRWENVLGVGVLMMLVVMLASLLSIRRVIVLEPAIVFR